MTVSVDSYLSTETFQELLSLNKLTKLSQFSNLKNIFVEFIIVCNREHNLIQPLQLFYVVWSDVP